MILYKLDGSVTPRTKGPAARANSGRPANRERADGGSGRLRSRSRALASREARASGRQIWQAQQQGRDPQALAQVRSGNKRDLRRHVSGGGHGRRQNEKRRMGTYRLEELWGEGAREDGRWSSPADEAPDRSPGDEEREMRRPHPSGVRYETGWRAVFAFWTLKMRRGLG